MNVVIDASVAIAMLIDGNRDELVPNAVPIAPDLLCPELLNVRRKYLRAGLRAPSLASILHFFDQITLVAMKPYADAAAQLADRLDHSPYDCFYVALAIAYEAKLLTRDMRLSRKLAEHDLGSIVA